MQPCRKESESRMTVTTLIEALRKVEHKDADVYLEDSKVISNLLMDVVIEHNLLDDNIVVILKKV